MTSPEVSPHPHVYCAGPAPTYTLKSSNRVAPKHVNVCCSLQTVSPRALVDVGILGSVPVTPRTSVPYKPTDTISTTAFTHLEIVEVTRSATIYHEGRTYPMAPVLILS